MVSPSFHESSTEKLRVSVVWPSFCVDWLDVCPNDLSFALQVPSPKIHAIDQTVGEPDRHMMRVVLLFTRACLLERELTG